MFRWCQFLGGVNVKVVSMLMFCQCLGVVNVKVLSML